MTDTAFPPRRFELGLVLAGAASAGTYTAGVVDFLIEALQAWQEAKATGDPSVPDHEVCIRAAAGTSAGGIVASLLAMLPFTRHWPIRDLATATTASSAMNASRNLLYRCWVVGTTCYNHPIATGANANTPNPMPAMTTLNTSTPGLRYMFFRYFWKLDGNSIAVL